MKSLETGAHTSLLTNLEKSSFEERKGIERYSDNVSR